MCYLHMLSHSRVHAALYPTVRHRSDVRYAFACGRVYVCADTRHLLLPTSSFLLPHPRHVSSCPCTASSQCSRIVIDNLTEACASDGMMYIGCKDAQRFSMSPRGARATAMWTTYSSHDHSRQGKLGLFLLEDTDPLEEYTICFNVTNPAVSQSAPNIDMLIKQREVRETGVRPRLSPPNALASRAIREECGFAASAPA